MPPSTAASGADPHGHHHSCLQLLTQWRVHHRGPCRAHQDPRLCLFKGRSSAQVSLCRKSVFLVEVLTSVERAGLGRTGTELHELLHVKTRSEGIISSVFCLRSSHRWQMTERKTERAPPCPAPRRPPAALRSPQPPLTSPRSDQLWSS